MPRLPPSVMPLAPAVVAFAILGPGRPALDALAADPGGARLVDALRWLAIVLPLGVALVAARFHQARLTFAALALAAIGAALLTEPAWLEGPGRPAMILGLALAMGLASRLPERGVTSRPGLRALILAGTLAALPAFLASRHSGELAHLLSRLGPGMQPAPGLGVSWLGLAVMACALVACRRAPGRDADLVGAPLATALAAALAALWLAHPLAAATALIGGAATLGVAMIAIAWRRGYVDDLTQLPGRRALDIALDGLSGAYAVAVIDIDHFKRFNDEHGHDTGDDALRIVARVLRTLRGGTAYRQGGEEFVAILPGASIEEAQDALEELRAALEATPLLLRARKRLRVTVSIGVAARSPAHDGARSVLRAADQALLRAKRLGRNRVEVSRSRVTAPARSSRTALARRAGDARPAPRRAAARGR